MDLLLFLGIYSAFILTFIFVTLFGHLEAFQGTPVAALHWFISEGVCRGFRWLTERFCGTRIDKALGLLERACCKSRNPGLAACYVLLVFGGYYLYSREIFMFLPQPYAPLWHQHTGALAVGACLLTFWATATSDPGYITDDNLATHLRLYPFDGLTSKEKDCWTCHRPRPARSKHCPLCNRCVAHFDHHCGWVNGCVGLLNLRFFLAFLLTNFLVCLYGVSLAAIILSGMVQRLGVLQRPFVDHNTGGLVLLKDHPLQLARWIAAEFPIQVVLLFFMLVAAVFVGAFLVYHLWLIAKGTTTYETFKRREAREDRALEALTQQHPEHDPKVLWAWLHRKGAPKIPKLPNMYDRGLRANFAEVFFPERLLNDRKSKQS